jgi:hypothetical protein
MMEVPSLTVERLRPVVLKGIVELGSWEEGVLKRVVGLPLEEDGEGLIGDPAGEVHLQHDLS